MYDAFIFDVDGVLIDTNSSFSNAITLAVATATGSKRFRDQHINRLKGISGFNNDWHVAIAGASWIEYGFGVSFNQFADSLKELSGGLAAVNKIFPALTENYQQYVTKLAKEAYGGTSACKQLYGFETETLFVEGMWQNEKTLVVPDTLGSVLDKSAIVTGRSIIEMDFAFRLLGFRLPANRVATSDNPILDKPNPSKCVKIIREMNWKKPIYFGDSADDYFLVKNVIKETGIQMDFCQVGNKNGLKEFDYHVENVMDFFKNERIKR